MAASENDNDQVRKRHREAKKATPEVKALIHELHKQDVPIREIARKVGLNHTYVHKILYPFGSPRQKHHAIPLPPDVRTALDSVIFPPLRRDRRGDRRARKKPSDK